MRPPGPGPRGRQAGKGRGLPGRVHRGGQGAGRQAGGVGPPELPLLVWGAKLHFGKWLVVWQTVQVQVDCSRAEPPCNSYGASCWELGGRPAAMHVCDLPAGPSYGRKRTRKTPGRLPHAAPYQPRAWPGDRGPPGTGWPWPLQMHEVTWVHSPEGQLQGSPA